jgi:hypothetical protein
MGDRWAEDASTAACWGELRLVFTGGVRALEMSAERVSAMVVDPDVDETDFASTSCLSLGFPFALRSLWRIPSREMIDFGGMTSASTSKNIVVLTRAAIKHASRLSWG